eukprot:jgi/Astpho2/239/Aster-x0015
MSRRGSRVKIPKADKAEALYAKYKDAEEDGIGPEGVEALCQDLKLDPSDRKVLVFAWKAGAKRMGFFSHDEFLTALRGCNGADTVAALRKALATIEEVLDDDDEEFQQFHAYAFTFCLTEEGKKIIDVDTAVQMLSVAMPTCKHLEPFTEFLQEQTEYRTINRDQWMGFLRFTQQVSPDCSNFDEAEAWPLLLDNYAEWVQKKEGDGGSQTVL